MITLGDAIGVWGQTEATLNAPVPQFSASDDEPDSQEVQEGPESPHGRAAHVHLHTRHKSSTSSTTPLVGIETQDAIDSKHSEQPSKEPAEEKDVTTPLAALDKGDITKPVLSAVTLNLEQEKITLDAIAETKEGEGSENGSENNDSEREEAEDDVALDVEQWNHNGVEYLVHRATLEIYNHEGRVIGKWDTHEATKDVPVPPHE